MNTFSTWLKLLGWLLERSLRRASIGVSSCCEIVTEVGVVVVAVVVVVVVVVAVAGVVIASAGIEDVVAVVVATEDISFSSLISFDCCANNLDCLLKSSRSSLTSSRSCAFSV